MNFSEKSKKVLNKIRKFFINLSNLQIIFLVYLLVTCLIGMLLLLPISQQENVDVSFIDALFTAASSFSDTGLTTKVTAET